MNVLVVGASRGIGLEFVRQYRAAGASVVATARQPADLQMLRGLGATAIPLDVTDAAGTGGLHQHLAQAALDLVIINAGVFGPLTDAPGAPTQAEFDRVMHTNVLGPMRVIEQVAADGVLAAAGAKLIVLSSTMASIEQRASGYAWLYCASKAALNSCLKSAAQALGERACCVALSPGWVKTAMGGAGAKLTPEESIAQMRQVIAGLTPAHNGGFLSHEGAPLLW